MTLPLNLSEVLLLAASAYYVTYFFVFSVLIGANPESGSKFSAWLDRFAYWPIDAPDGVVPGSDKSFFRGKIGDLMTCPWCLGFHISWVIVCLATSTLPWELGISGWLAAAAIAGIQGFVHDKTS